MKLEFLSFDFEKFAQEMQDLKDKKGFDYSCHHRRRGFWRRGRLRLCLYPREYHDPRALQREDVGQDPGLWRRHVEQW